MNKKLFMLSLGLGLFLIGCQSDVNTENPEEINEFQESNKEVKHDVNKWHVPEGEGFTANGFKLHQAGYFQGALADCDTYAHYEGGDNLIVVEDDPQSYHGEVNVKNISVNDQLNICGTVRVNNNVKVNYRGIFNLGGELFNEGDLRINYGGHLVVEGNVVIKGDLELNKGALVKFIGDNSSIEVLGKTRIHKDVTIEGNFKDISNKIN
ncbi:hypothetical protein GCM10023115_33370 [Pontixanthobacter gangjinensis]|uniref:Uncharacterized protein n=1 Tax=Christiangramia aestuarii TaxID=1028746 RepID=A0A7K1LSI1_9FLAO|nr:hypothetical protein [Christiangramia aestuarii]MUP43753.1 hypothetical protein [Christiangramia aestuarii]